MFKQYSLFKARKSHKEEQARDWLHNRQKVMKLHTYSDESNWKFKGYLP